MNTRPAQRGPRPAEPASPPLRIPGRLTARLHIACAALVGVYASLTWVSTGLFATGGSLLLASLCAVWAALTWACLPARGTVAPGVSTVAGSRVLAGLLLCAWFAALAGTVVWVVEAARTSGDVQQPGFVLVMAAGALASLPDLVRLLTGRIRPAHLEAGPEGIFYTAGKTAVRVPWTDVESIHVNESRTRVLVTTHPHTKDLDVSTLIFDVPADDLARILHDARPRPNLRR